MKTTRFIFIAIVASISLQSCFVNRYQKVQTKWEKAKPNTTDFTTPDSMLNMHYSMWKTQGQIMLDIRNLTDSTVYINPWYTFEIVQKTDTNYLYSPALLSIKKYNGSAFISDDELEEMIYYGEEIPIPPKGIMTVKSACISCYLQLDYEDNDPTGLRDSVTYNINNSPFSYERRVGYAFPSDTSLRVVKHVAYINKIDRYRFVWNIDDIPADKVEDRSFYVHSQRPSVITWLGMVGLGVIYVLGQVSGEEE